MTDIKNESSSLSADELYDLIQPLNPKDLSKSNNIEEALARNTEAEADTRILITGSLYFLGTILT